MSKVGHLKLALVVRRKTKSTDVFKHYWIRFIKYPSCILVFQNVAILYTISRQIAMSTNIENAERV